MPLPCANDLRFIHDKTAVMAEAAPICGGCPVIDACWESRKGEPWGVIAGTLPDSPVRVEARKPARARDAKTCRNGHPLKLYATRLEDQGMPSIEKMAHGCRRCNDIARWMDDDDRPEVCPETVPNGEDPVAPVAGSQRTHKNRRPIPHGTPAGYKAHWRRKEKACASCLRAHSAARTRYEQPA